MMRSPPTAVPRPMLKAQKIMSHMGIATPVRSMPMPAVIMMASMKMDMNFWPSWGAMHEGHAGAGANLRPLEERVRLLTVHMPAQPPDELVVEPAQAEAEQRREQNAVDDLHPLGPVDGIEATLDGDGRPREAGDERMGLGGGNAEPPGRRAPDDNGDHRCHERRQGLMGVAAEIHHGEMVWATAVETSDTSKSPRKLTPPP